MYVARHNPRYRRLGALGQSYISTAPPPTPAGYSGTTLLMALAGGGAAGYYLRPKIAGMKRAVFGGRRSAPTFGEETQQNPMEDTLTMVLLVGMAGLALYYLLKNLPGLGTGNAPSSLSTLYNAATGQLSPAQIAALNSQLGSSVLAAGGSAADAAAAIAEQNAYIQNHPPSDPSFTDDLTYLWQSVTGGTATPAAALQGGGGAF